MNPKIEPTCHFRITQSGEECKRDNTSSVSYCMGVYRTFTLFNKTSRIVDEPRSGQLRSVQIKQFKKSIRERIRFDTKRSIQKMAKESDISNRTVRRLVNDDLGLKLYKFQVTPIILFADISSTSRNPM